MQKSLNCTKIGRRTPADLQSTLVSGSVLSFVREESQLPSLPLSLSLPVLIYPSQFKHKRARDRVPKMTNEGKVADFKRVHTPNLMAGDPMNTTSMNLHEKTGSLFPNFHALSWALNFHFVPAVSCDPHKVKKSAQDNGKKKTKKGKKQLQLTNSYQARDAESQIFRQHTSEMRWATLRFTKTLYTIGFFD